MALMRAPRLPERPPKQTQPPSLFIPLSSTPASQGNLPPGFDFFFFFLSSSFSAPFGILVLASSNPLAPIIISALLITDNKETWRRCAAHNSQDSFPNTAGKDLFIFFNKCNYMGIGERKLFSIECIKCQKTAGGKKQTNTIKINLTINLKRLL